MPKFPSTYKTVALKRGIVSIVTRTFPQDVLGENTVVLKPDYIGICRADIKEIVGSRDIPTDRGPLFGHEFVGSVAFAGTRTGFQDGELVTFNPNIVPTRTTGFAEYVFVHGSEEQLAQAIVRVPEPAILDNIWMPEPFACVVHAVQKLFEIANLTSLEGKKVGIIGAGCSGVMFAMYAKHLGASVIVLNRGEMRRNFARARGLLAKSEVFALTEFEAHRNSCDVVIVVPTIITPTLLENAADMGVNGAIVHIYGGTRQGDLFPSTQLDIDTVRRNEHIQSVDYQGKKLRVSGAYGCFKEDYEESFRLHKQYPDRFPLEKIVSKHITFDEISALMMGVAAKTEDYPGKVILKVA
ncbi:medium chain dehydrogenase/reductase family protein [Agrobacterium sp. rho-13.3]|uniref:medium chain dehydrogenase/reductase family protein n=1 Tax=Agrobacterium sp. rho-13.3 TaxID=3072980 RepID=UPI002A15E7C7|nr:medium chain dehydrogenase/reductase family protein [Agrobacterium sp. rho-13.3]MDX8308095.1 medium chain dehydrogenase/reductase family protein [Agrobacterium sp. rho-13.3]